MQNIWKVKVNINEHYFSTEEKTLNFINNKIGKIVKQNIRNKDNQKIVCELNNNLINVRLIKLNIDEGI